VASTPGDAPLGDNKAVPFGIGMDVQDAYGQVILINLVCLGLARNDFVKKCIASLLHKR
jgi:hypothetical protein